MRVDFEKFDGQILLHASPRRGVWSYEIMLKNSRNTRTAGQAPTSTTAHGLLVLAAISALKSISNNKAMAAARGRSNKAKARLNIVSNDQSFCDALRALMQNDKSVLADTPLRAGRNLLRPLARELARFDITLTTDADDESYLFQALGNFARLHVRDPKELANLPTMLVPVVASEVV